MTTLEMLDFARGEFFYGALLFFIGGMSYRLVQVLGLGWRSDRTAPKKSQPLGVVVSFLRGILILPFIPWVRGTFQRQPIVYIAGGLFHLGLFVVIFFGTAHVMVWRDLLGSVSLGFAWPSLALPLVDLLAAVAIVAMLVLLMYRLTHPVMQKLTGPADMLNWLFVFLPMITGYLLTNQAFLRYEEMFLLHQMTVNIMLIWIPLGRISHFIFYFFSRSIHGSEYAKRGAQV
ncbi:MAG: hypothetical protein GYB66_12665 [Chloroflexi bacterium]|nr:hypothetical protein [Chloroflexota bacterium]